MDNSSINILISKFVFIILDFNITCGINSYRVHLEIIMFTFCEKLIIIIL